MVLYKYSSFPFSWESMRKIYYEAIQPHAWMCSGKWGSVINISLRYFVRVTGRIFCLNGSDDMISQPPVHWR